MAITKLFENGNKPNIVIIITDQQRALQHYPKDFIKDKLPALKWLMDNGLSFDRAFTASCACAPSRATFLTSQYPAKHKTTNTGQMEPKRPLNVQLPNLAHVLKEAGYETRAWLGKWHLGEIHTDPIAAGFTEWNAPDAGITIGDYNTLGGGSPDNDGRYLADILKFIDEHRDDPEPFCLVASFVNPHDGFVAVRGLGGSGYASSVFTKIPVPMPENWNSPLTYKPRAQASASWAALSAQTDPTKQPKHRPQDYVNFYAYLQTLVDKQIDQILLHMGRKSETNEQNSKLIDDTLIIRFADHGEMGMSHGLVEKFFNAYEESIRIPFVFSNPIAYPTAQTTQSLASSVDLVPTLAELLGVTWYKPDEPMPAIANPMVFYGQDLSPILEGSTEPVQESVHFTYDDNPGRGPSIVRTIRTEHWKYSVYFNEDGSDADWELYDLKEDWLETYNLAGIDDPVIVEEQEKLEGQLRKTMTRLGTMPRCFDWPPQKTELSRGVKPNTTPPVAVPFAIPIP